MLVTVGSHILGENESVPYGLLRTRISPVTSSQVGLDPPGSKLQSLRPRLHLTKDNPIYQLLSGQKFGGVASVHGGLI